MWTLNWYLGDDWWCFTSTDKGPVPNGTLHVHLRSYSATGQRLCWTQHPRRRPDLQDRKSEGHKSCGCRTNPQAASVVPSRTPFSSGCRGQCVFRSTSAQTAYRCYSGYNKTQTNILKKRAHFLFHTIRVARPHMATNRSKQSNP